MLSLSANPSILSPGVNSLAELPGIWWIAYTRSRFEKAFARDLCSLGIGYFLPMYEMAGFSGGRYRLLMSLLFPSYVFFCGTEEDRYKALKTNRLCYTLDVVDQRQLIEELADIESALLRKTVVGAHKGHAMGRRCRVISGPMEGIEGIVVQEGCPKARMVIEVAILGQGALVEIDTDLLQFLE